MLLMQLIRQEAMAAFRQPLDRIKLASQVGRAPPEPGCQPKDQQLSVVPYWRYWIGHAVKRFHNRVLQRVMPLIPMGFVKGMFPKYNPKTEFPKFFAANLLSGSIAATIGMLVSYPGGYVHNLLDIDSLCSGGPRFSGPADVVRKTWARDGFAGFYTGFGVAIVGIMGYRAFQLAFFESIVSLNPYRQDKGMTGTVTKVLCAQVAVHIGAVATYPFDIVRVRLMQQSCWPVEERLYQGPVDCLMKIAAEEGVLGLYAGFRYSALLSVSLALARIWLPGWGF